MRRTITIIATLAVGLVVTNPLAAGRATKDVAVDDDFFAPDSLTIKEDTRVRFTWVGENQHNVMKDDGPGKFFESDSIKGAGYVYTHKFTKRGRYTIICSLHDGMEMDLRVKRRRN